jgi:Protein of unknown function (DUF1353)
MSNGFGSFSGNPKTEWLDEAGADRRMKLLEDFWYEDPSGRRWPALSGRNIDGASIPAPLWSVVGSPYTGEYRRASIVHDIACEDPNVPRKDADKMVYVACLAGGCSKRQARPLYAGVRVGAWTPNVRIWSEAAMRSPVVTRDGVRMRLTDTSVQTTFSEIAAELEAQPDDLPFEAVEEIVGRQLQAKSQQ